MKNPRITLVRHNANKNTIIINNNKNYLHLDPLHHQKQHTICFLTLQRFDDEVLDKNLQKYALCECELPCPHDDDPNQFKHAHNNFYSKHNPIKILKY